MEVEVEECHPDLRVWFRWVEEGGCHQAPMEFPGKQKPRIHDVYLPAIGCDGVEGIVNGNAFTHNGTRRHSRCNRASSNNPCHLACDGAGLLPSDSGNGAPNGRHPGASRADSPRSQNRRDNQWGGCVAEGVRPCPLACKGCRHSAS